MRGVTMGDKSMVNTCFSKSGAALWAVLLAALCGTGCLELPRESTPIRYWTLAPVLSTSTAAAAAATDGPNRSLAVGPVTLPVYLDRYEILHRSGDHQLLIERFDHWAGSLEEQIPRVLAQDIMARSPTVRAAPYPFRFEARAGLQLLIAVLAFEVDGAGMLQLQAEWTVFDTNNGESVARAVTNLTESAGDRSVEEIVGAMSRALGALAQEVVDALP